ncbi:ABC transporter permease|uniref:FtsX-like permease family protein n=1 Tax=Noviherbaspirillum sp. L7-7A TaxID=2850560 RepID=UPI001C2C59D3|nr:FtsX-like permease family protein [Noviherbaspirillum sp. L7-7A]MBV0878028.1 ABC transporter permease [Noviherbaspirillum sp. L7-7A]
MNASLARWLLAGEWRMHPVRALVAMGAIALGVALGFAIHLINAAAFNEFTAAVKSVSGVSDLQVRGAQASFDEALFPRLAQREGVTLASPVLEVDATVRDRQGTLKILGVDVFRAAAIAPDLVGVPQQGRAFDTLMDDTIFLSPAAMSWLEVKAGDMLTLRSGTVDIRLRVAGGLVRARSGQRIAVMDIAAAQWRFDRLGKLSRIELKLEPGIDREAFRASLQRELGAAYLLTETEDQEARSNNMSRAYRVNLNVLALVALFTGAFLVFSTQALSVIRRRQQFALLRVLGSSRRQVLAQVLAEGALLGVAGSLLGLALGYLLAALALRAFGGDLGGGYFPGVQPSVRFQPLAALVFFLAGSGIAILGSASPAWEAARARPAPALKAGSEDVALARLARPWPALACLLLGAALTRLPPVHGLPIFGYLAVALLLIGGIALMPRFAAWVFNAAASLRARRGAVGTLALARLANAPNQASIALGGVLSSFALMVAMAIMVSSFRVSVDDWLRHILAADLYLRSPAAADAGGLGPEQQRRIAALPGVLRADFQRVTQLSLDPAQPGVALIARPIDAADPGRTLPLTGPSMDAGTARPVWISEAMVDLYGYQVGKTITLPISGSPQPLLVAGVWRDYARQSGAIQMQLSDYQALTGDMTVSDAALWLKPDARASDVAAAVRALPFGAALELAEPGEIRALSLKIFDRSFAITYLLEAVAIIIGLFGVAATFSAQTMARAREFGMLRHIGVTRRQVLAMLATEGALLTAAGIAVGFLLGWCISLILVFIVNPQSFHWTMQLHMPWPTLATVAAALLASAAATALLAGRQAVSGDAVRAVREDW